MAGIIHSYSGKLKVSTKMKAGVIKSLNSEPYNVCLHDLKDKNCNSFHPLCVMLVVVGLTYRQGGHSPELQVPRSFSASLGPGSPAYPLTLQIMTTQYTLIQKYTRTMHKQSVVGIYYTCTCMRHLRLAVLLIHVSEACLHVYIIFMQFKPSIEVLYTQYLRVCRLVHTV